MADKAAKAASKDSTLPECYSSISKTHLKFILRTRTLQHWQQLWDSTKNGQHLKNYIPDIQTYFNDRNITTDFHTTQLLTGHGSVNAYFKRFNIKTSGVCECDFKTEQTYRHLLYDCRLLTDQRRRLQQEITKNKGIWPVDESTMFFKHFKALRTFAVEMFEVMEKWHTHYR